jgi:hypothetical protein
VIVFVNEINQRLYKYVILKSVQQLLHTLGTLEVGEIVQFLVDDEFRQEKYTVSPLTEQVQVIVIVLGQNQQQVHHVILKLVLQMLHILGLGEVGEVV